MKPGLIETMYWDGKDIAFVAFHLQRFYAGLSFYDIDFRQSPQELFDLLLHEVQKTDAHASKKLRLHLSREPQDTLHITATPFVRSDKALRLGIADGLRIQTSAHNGLKTDQRAIYDAAAQQAKQRYCDDLLILNEANRVVESSIMNIFWKNEGDAKFYTPPIEEGCVAGIMRRVLLLQENFSEKCLNIESLKNAEAVFVCNALRGIVPVAAIEDVKTYVL